MNALITVGFPKLPYWIRLHVASANSTSQILQSRLGFTGGARREAAICSTPLAGGGCSVVLVAVVTQCPLRCVRTASALVQGRLLHILGNCKIIYLWIKLFLVLQGLPYSLKTESFTFTTKYLSDSSCMSAYSLNLGELFVMVIACVCVL